MTDRKLIAGKLSPTSVVEIAPGVDFSRLRLSSEEAFLMSRVGAGISAGDLLASSALAEDRATAVIQALFQKGCLRERESPAMAEVVDLTPERKREILSLESRLEESNPFELLGVPDGAKPEVCKAAYYDLSMKFHPDRYYGKQLGTFKARIDRIFKRLTDAQAQVTDPAKRAALERDNPLLFVGAGSNAPAEKVVHDTVRAEDRARRIARHPYLAKVARVREHLAKARKNLADNEPMKAAGELQLLLGVDPANAEAKALQVEVNAKMAVVRAEQAFNEGNRLVKAGEHQSALAQFMAALEQKPNVAICEKGLECALRVQDYKSGRTLATKWVDLAPRNAKAHLALGEVLQLAGLPKNAKREAEEALKLEPDNKAAKALLAKVRWA